MEDLNYYFIHISSKAENVLLYVKDFFLTKKTHFRGQIVLKGRHLSHKVCTIYASPFQIPSIMSTTQGSLQSSTRAKNSLALRFVPSSPK